MDKRGEGLKTERRVVIRWAASRLLGLCARLAQAGQDRPQPRESCPPESPEDANLR